MKKHRLFWWIYGAGTLCLLVAAALVLGGLKQRLRDYQAARPETAAAAVAEKVQAAAADGSLWEIMTRPELPQSRFEAGEDPLAAYASSLIGASLTPRRVGGASGERITYVLETGGAAVARLTLAARNTHTEWGLFTMSEWCVESLTPVYTLHDLTYTLCLPRGFSATVNGLPLSESEQTGSEEDAVTYTVAHLHREPSFAVADGAGRPAAYDISDGVLTPVTHTEVLRLSPGLSVTADGQEVPPSGEADGRLLYRIVSAAPAEIVIRDAFGGSVAYVPGLAVAASQKTVTIPASYRLTVGVRAADPATAEAVASRAWPADLPADLPPLCRYTFFSLDATAVRITDNRGRTTLLAEPDGTEILCPEPEAEWPAFLPGERFLLTVAETWSRFMTDDLTGANHGLAQVQNYLVRGCYLWDMARRWANGVDITLCSIHTLCDPPFTEERVSGLRLWSEDVFSADVTLTKQMRLYYGARVEDTMNARLWFCRTADGWRLGAMQELGKETA